MSYNEGLINEERMIYALNDKKFSELNANLQHFVTFLLPKLDKEQKVKCFHAEDYTKPDFCVQQNDTRRFVSLKHGTCETLHDEKLDRFIQFLMENGIDAETIESYLLFHFGDGTTDGSGTKRMNNFEVKLAYSKRLTKMNKVFNQSKEFIKKFADRVMFQGVNPLAEPAEIIYHGDEDFGCFCSKNQVMRHLELRRWDYMVSVVHIGPFILRPKARYPNKEIKNDDSRRKVVVSYPRLLSEIMYMFSRYKF